MYVPNNLNYHKLPYISQVLSRKKHSKPATPYQALLESKHISEAKKQELTEIYNQLNQFELKKTIQKKSNVIFSMIHLAHDQKMRYIKIYRTARDSGGCKGIKTEEVSLQPPFTRQGILLNESLYLETSVMRRRPTLWLHLAMR